MISNLGWLMLFCVIYRTQIRKSYLQRQLLRILSLIITKKKKERNNKTTFKTFLLEFISNFK